MITQILIPTDFSHASWKATKIGIELAKLNNAQVNILHVIPFVSRFSNTKSQQHLPEKIDEIRLRMNDISKELSEESVKIENMVLSGNVEETMLELIDRKEYDLVILGVNSHGTNNELGSHTSLVIEKSGIPVLIVPNNTHSHGAIAS